MYPKQIAKKPTKLLVYNFGIPSGELRRTSKGYEFKYLASYLSRPTASSIAHLLPLREEPYESQKLFPFFEGLCFEGELLAAYSQSCRIDPTDYFTLLANFGEDTIGSTTYEVIE